MTIANRSFGIEIEAFNCDMGVVRSSLRAAGIPVAHGSYNGAGEWAVKYDGSIQGARGFELVSPILTGDAGLATVATVCAVLNAIGAKVNKSTGLHCHVDARGANAKQIGNVLRYWAKYESCVMEMMPPSRHNNGYCRRVFEAHQTTDARFAEIARREVMGLPALLRISGTRYVTLNLESCNRHGSVEFRVHNGTTSAEKITNWVKFCVGLTDKAFSFTSSVRKNGAGDFNDMAFAVDTSAWTYLLARRAAVTPTSGAARAMSNADRRAA